MGRGGFEPPKELPADLQSAPFGHSGTYPYIIKLIENIWSWLSESNQQPADYKSAALPVELSQHWCLGADLNHRHGDFQSPALPAELPRQKIGDPEGTRTLDL